MSKLGGRLSRYGSHLLTGVVGAVVGASLFRLVSDRAPPPVIYEGSGRILSIDNASSLLPLEAGMYGSSADSQSLGSAPSGVQSVLDLLSENAASTNVSSENGNSWSDYALSDEITISDGQNASDVTATIHNAWLPVHDKTKEKLEATETEDSLVNASQILKYGWPSQMEIKIRDGYVAAYDRRLKIPAWTCQRLTQENLKKGDTSRDKSQFRPDPSVPEQFRIKETDYRASGYDRGHMAPARDMAYNQAAMDGTFYMSNMAPQVGAGFNRDYWARLEEFARVLTEEFEEVYVVTGPLFIPLIDEKTGRKYVNYEVIGNNKDIAVPTHFFKAILAVDKWGSFHAGAFAVPNEITPGSVPITKFKVPIRVLEEQAGLILFDKVPSKKFDLCAKKDRCTLPTRAQEMITSDWTMKKLPLSSQKKAHTKVRQIGEHGKEKEIWLDSKALDDVVTAVVKKQANGSLRGRAATTDDLPHPKSKGFK